MRNYLLAITFSLTVCLLFSQCRKADNALPINTDIVPEAPDYNEHGQWFITERQANADIFYITSTETGDYTLPDGNVCHYADTRNDSVRQAIYDEMTGVDQLIGGRLNFYSPYYRQCSLQSFENDSVTKVRMRVPIDDVKRAFDYYMTHINGGRPFVLAGFSQGAMAIIELLKEMDDETYHRMIAAYAIGITITQETLDACPNIIPAQGADDTGVTICYNSVRDASCALRGWTHSDVVINPVNWHTDATPATLITEPSPFIPLEQQGKDTLTVHIDATSGFLIVSGYTANDYILPLIGKEGCYHSREIWLYRDQLRDNIARRTANYLENSLAPKH